MVTAVNIMLLQKIVNSVPLNGNQALVRIGEAPPMAVFVADTPEEQRKGLSGRTSLSDNEGLFFVFVKPAYHSFWMKDMRFPIDIIWVGENGRVLGINDKIEPESFPKVFQPPAPALYVIEVAAGWAERHNIKIGDLIYIDAI
jgi:uncharacterized membrane protein (UPF0127 family)